MKSINLSKTKYMIGLQCPKLLWTTYNEPERIPERSAAGQYRMDQGLIIGEIAKKWFENGLDLSDENFKRNIVKTEKAVKDGDKILFEAGIPIGNLYSRADVLVPFGKEWDVIEVKSTTEVKDEHIEDVAFQKHVYEKYGLKIRKCFLMHVNNQYIKKGEIEPKELFILADITEEVNEKIKGIEDRIDNMFKIIQSKKKPGICLGTYCQNPYTCSMMEECWKDLPDENVFDLYSGGKKSFELYDRGILELKDIPKDFKLSEKQKIQVECAECGKPKIIKEKIKDFLEELKYPLYCLDFETINPVVPRYDGMKPYQRITFQFSLHIQEKPGAKPKHISFLADGVDDPRPKLMQELKDNLGEKGSIVAYNSGFETGAIKECMEAFPEFKKWGEKILERFVDLLQPFRQFHFYHPMQKGSASLKAVLPALSNLNYEDFEIGNGEDASLAYERITYGLGVDEKEKQKVRKQLEEYCALDTLAEVKIIDRLWEIIK